MQDDKSTTTCPNCNKQLLIPQDLAGKSIRCPSCSTVFVAPGPAPILDVVPIPPAGQIQVQPSAPLQPPARDWNERDDFPSRPIRRHASIYAPCPACGAEDPDKVTYTLWGGLIGPAIFKQVKCRSCRTSYNGKTGKPIGGAIAIYLVVTLAISFVIMFACCGLGLLGK